MSVGSPAVDEVERWFLSRGLPHFIDGYSASRDVLTRALPVLTLILLIELSGALNFAWAWWANLIVAAAAFAVLFAVWAIVNRMRHRPALSRPDRVGIPEAAVFVLVPALLPLLGGGQWLSSVNTFVGNLLLLGFIYLVLSYGLVPMTRWAGGRLWVQVGSLFGLLVRALPLLLLFVVFLFLTNEMWQVAASLDGPYLLVVTGLFVLLGAVFVVSRIPREVGAIARFGSCDEIREVVAGTPAEPLAVALPADCATSAVSMSRRQLGNVGLVVLFSQAVQVVFVSAMIFVFLVAFGVLAVTPEIAADWSGTEVHVLLDGTLWGRPVALTAELLTVACLLAVVAGFSFTLSLLTDDTYRREFLEDVLGEVRQAFAVRAAYLHVLADG
ncbi:MAG: hypothetical protein ACRD12_16685 [Acidimicrobiales bacterium]